VALTKVTIVHDIFGQIVSINRPAKEAKVVVLPSNGHYIFDADVDPDSINELIRTHIVDIGKKSLVPHKKPTKADKY
jgi:hypothetical protein